MTEQVETLPPPIGHTDRPRKRVRRPAPEIWDDPDSVLPFYAWAEKAGISKRQAKRLRQTGQAPRCVLIGARMLGVTLAEHRRWLKARMEPLAA